MFITLAPSTSVFYNLLFVEIYPRPCEPRAWSIPTSTKWMKCQFTVHKNDAEWNWWVTSFSVYGDKLVSKKSFLRCNVNIRWRLPRKPAVLWHWHKDNVKLHCWKDNDDLPCGQCGQTTVCQRRTRWHWQSFSPKGTVTAGCWLKVFC